MKTLRVPRAVYRWERHGNVVTLFDLWAAMLPTRALTDDIAGVLDNLRREGHLRPGDQVIFRDTEVAIDAECRFVEFRLDTAEQIGDVARRVVARLSVDDEQ
jgi:hypothetical protein